MTGELKDEWDESGLMGCQFQEQNRSLMLRAAKYGLNPWSVRICESIWYDYGQVNSKKRLSERAFGTYAIRYPEKAVQEIDRSFELGLIHFLTAGFLEQKRRELDDGQYIKTHELIGSNEPTEEGLISFTELGVKTYIRFLRDGAHELWPHSTAVESVEGCVTVYGTSFEECEDHLRSETREILDSGPIRPVGRWCDRWWNLFESGFMTSYHCVQDVVK